MLFSIPYEKLIRTEISKSASLNTTYTQIMQIGDFILIHIHILYSVSSDYNT